jgi:arylsulfatase
MVWAGNRIEKRREVTDMLFEDRNWRRLTGMLPSVFAVAVIGAFYGCAQQETPESAPESQFDGVIETDIRDSKPDWAPFTPAKAPEGAPNILFVLYDDTGLAAWSPYGGGVNMPTLDRIADRGLIYTNWHTTALCSPTRSTLLTGRNHHLNGMSSITEAAVGFPGGNGRIPDETATIGELLQDAGYSTFWLGKNHNVPETDVASGASRDRWPLGMGFDRFYGFLGGETNQWYPDQRATTSPGTWRIKPSRWSRTTGPRIPPGPGTCGSIPVQIMHLTTRPKTT